MASTKKPKKASRATVLNAQKPLAGKQSKPEVVAEDNKSRKSRTEQYRSFRLNKPIRHTSERLSPARRLFKEALVLLWRNKKLFGGILLIYGFTQLVFVKGLIASESFTGDTNFFTYLLGANRNVSADGAVYQTLLLLVASLAIIWALRQVYANANIGIRDSYYKGMYPLVPLIIVISIVILQAIPLFFAAWLYNLVIVGGIAASLIEQAIWIIICSLFALLTFYMVSSSIIAVYIVTLPDMTPIKALRSARDLVHYRRLEIFWRVVALSISSLILLALIMVPVIIVLPGFAPWMFYFVSIGLLAFTHAYMYGLYRELLNAA